MTAAQLVETLATKGVILDPRGDKLHVQPASRLTPEELDGLRALKPAVMALLATPPRSEMPRRAEAFLAQLAAWVAAKRLAVPLLTLPDAPPPTPGACVSCGVALDPGQTWRCARCSHTVRLAVGETGDTR